MSRYQAQLEKHLQAEEKQVWGGEVWGGLCGPVWFSKSLLRPLLLLMLMLLMMPPPQQFMLPCPVCLCCAAVPRGSHPSP